MIDFILNLILIGLLIILAIFMFMVTQQGSDTNTESSTNDQHQATHENDSDSNNSINTIFLNYHHNSIQDWLKEALRLDTDDKKKALDMLHDHLDNDPSHWGAITFEVLTCIEAFNERSSFEPICEFMSKGRSVWLDFVSIPKFYQRAGEIILKLKPFTAIDFIESEFNTPSNDKTNRKNILIDICSQAPKEVNISELYNKIIKDKKENIEIKQAIIQAIPKLNKDEALSVIRFTFQVIFNTSSLEATNSPILTKNDFIILEDLMEIVIANINQPSYSDLLNNEFQHNEVHYTIARVINDLLHKAHIEIDKTAQYGLSILQDTHDNLIKSALIKAHDFTESEQEIILEMAPNSLESNDWSLVNTEEKKYNLSLPIPKIYAENYEIFYNSLFKSNALLAPDKNQYKSFGGILINGNDEEEKLYFTRAFAQEKKWDFAYINLEELRDKNDLAKLQKTFNTISKPGIIYIKNLEYLFDSYMRESELHAKSHQALRIAAVDNKLFLIGTIAKPTVSLDKHEQTNLSKLMSKFFPQTLEYNQYSKIERSKMLDSIISKISEDKAGKTDDLKNEIIDMSNHLSNIEFYFNSLKLIQSMLLVHGKLTSVYELQKIKSKIN